jgi:hypothetical protein
MKFRQFSVCALVTIAAIIGNQTLASSQERFKTPTHPTLSEITNSEPMSTTQPSNLSADSYRTPSRPTRSEVGQSPLTSSPMPPSVMPANPTSSSSSMGNGRMAFSRAPKLIRNNASHKNASTPSTYEFTVTVPSDAGAPLQSLRIVQDPNIETVNFNVSDSKAFMGDRFGAGQELSLSSVGGTQPTLGEATIVFAQPIQPGSTVTVALDVPQNPISAGVYEFGVTAFPVGDQGTGQFLGYGRVNLYGGGN